MGERTGLVPYNEPYSLERRAGSEYPAHPKLTMDTIDDDREIMEAAPGVLKGPAWSFCLKYLKALEIVDIDHVILPFRDLDVSTRSRLSVGLDWFIDEELTGEEKFQQQSLIHAAALGRVIESCYLWSIPCTTMHFPLFIHDKEYCYNKLSEAFSLDQSKFYREHELLARPDQIEFK